MALCSLNTLILSDFAVSLAMESSNHGIFIPFSKTASGERTTTLGSCSLLLLGKEGIYAARDRYGYTPLVVGQRGNDWAVTTETAAFSNLDFKIIKYLQPGEIVLIDKKGLKFKRKGKKENQICAFLWIYSGFPASSYEGIAVEIVRERCGKFLAKSDSVKVDMVAGIPDSGIGHAIGYANRKCIPYIRPFVKYTPTWPRSFMPQNQSLRDLVARMKLIPIRKLIKGKRILFCEDSIVRGTQLKDHIEILFDVGAREVHMRPACPTLIYPCEFINFSTSRSTLDLAGRKVIDQLENGREADILPYATTGSAQNRRMVEAIGQQLKLTSLKYQKLENMVAAIGLPKEKLCTHCWDGSSYF